VEGPINISLASNSWKYQEKYLSISNNTGQQNLPFFVPRTSIGELTAVRFMLNSDMYTELFYQAEFERYRGLYLCKMVLYILTKQAETYL